MGTNYFLHLGKRSGDRPDGCTFTVASDGELDAALADRPVIEDEYGRRLTPREFAELLKGDVIDRSHVGEEFS